VRNQVSSRLCYLQFSHFETRKPLKITTTRFEMFFKVYYHLPSLIADLPSASKPAGIFPSCDTFFRAMSCSLFSLKMVLGKKH